MADDIIFLLPNEASCYYTQQVLKKHGLQIPVYEAFANEGVLQAKQKIEQGTKVIISRGNTTQILRDALEIPVVEVRYSFYEFAVAMQKAIEISSHVALVGYNNAFNLPELANFFPLEQLEIRIIEPHQTKETLESLKAQGIEVVISGQRISKMAHKVGLQSVLAWISEKNILDALTDATHLRNLEAEKQRQFSSIATLLEQAQEGILSIDRDGHIQAQNQISQQLLQTDAATPRDSIFHYLPRNYVKQILNGLPLYNEVISLRHDRILLSGVATHAGDEISGAVLTLQPAADIHRKEYELRRKSHIKGHTAKNSFESIVGNSPALQAAKAQARFFAATESNVLIYGPTGTGKELFAQSIHNASRRRRNPFVAINCAALPESVLESELFGYVKGAFTGARPEGKMGIFEQAHTGTIFLDEVSEVSPAVQARLLRVIQEREITRIGDDKIIPIDVRIIASTNRNLLTEIQEKRFREDLFYRLSVLNLSLPSLQQRREDIPLLAEYFLQYFGRLTDKNQTFSSDALQPLLDLTWPGNIRQLRNTVECAVALCQEPVIDRKMIETVLKISFASTQQETPAPLAVCEPRAYRPTAEEERAHIFSVLDACGGNKTLAAKQLGIGYTTLWRKLKSYAAE